EIHRRNDRSYSNVVDGIPFQTGECKQVAAHNAVFVDGSVPFCGQSPVDDKTLAIENAKRRIRIAHIHDEKHLHSRDRTRLACFPCPRRTFKYTSNLPERRYAGRVLSHVWYHIM